MVLSNTLINLDDSINILTKNKDSIKNLNIDFKSYINLSLVPASLKDNLIKILNPLNEIFKIDINMDSIKNLDQTSKVAVNSFLDNSLGWIIDIFKALTK
jgi:hypothetical protein